jgi:hypothetical protein
MYPIETVTLSSDFQIAISEKTCAFVGFQSGEKLDMIAYDKRIELIPSQQMKSFRGIAKGVNTCIEREDDRL